MHILIKFLEYESAMFITYERTSQIYQKDIQKYYFYGRYILHIITKINANIASFTDCICTMILYSTHS